MSDIKVQEPVEAKSPAKEPVQPIAFVFADCKQQIVQAVRNVVTGYRLPLWMVEAILESVLSEYRHEAYLELAADSVKLKFEQDKYLEDRVKEAEAALIAKFEEGPAKK